jgi:gamma-glutamyltranspeptidase/glutathione hydrolase
MVVNTPGGDVQCQAILQTFLGNTVFDLPPQAAIEQPRFATFSFPNSFYPYVYLPGLLHLEGRVADAVAADLSARGHQVERWADWDPAAGACCMVTRAADGTLAAGADPRRYAYAAGW